MVTGKSTDAAATRETLSGFRRAPDTSPEPPRRLAVRDPGKTDTPVTKLLERKGGFSWDTDGEALLRKHKPSYFDGSLPPRTGPAVRPALQRPFPRPRPVSRSAAASAVRALEGFLHQHAIAAAVYPIWHLRAS